MRAALAGLALACLAASCGPAVKAPQGGVVVRFGKHALAAEVASTEAARERGLMERRSLGSNAGMLFVFPSPPTCSGEVCGFWMKNTLIPLSIAFMTSTGASTYRVVAVMEMTPCRTVRCPTYGPRSPYDGAVEANAGWLEKAGVGPGSFASVAGRLPIPL